MTYTIEEESKSKLLKCIELEMDRITKEIRYRRNIEETLQEIDLSHEHEILKLIIKFSKLHNIAFNAKKRYIREPL
jgi:hypothetical protein